MKFRKKPVVVDAVQTRVRVKHPRHYATKASRSCNRPKPAYYVLARAVDNPATHGKGYFSPSEEENKRNVTMTSLGAESQSVLSSSGSGLKTLS